MDKDCPFCEILPNRSREILFETKFFFSFTPKWPINSGHALIVPKRHMESVFELTAQEMSGLRTALNGVKKVLDAKYHPDGYNIGINIGAAAGQTVFHLHVHIIPRFKNDVPDPRGGIIRQLLQNYKTTERPSWLPEFPENKSSQ